MNRRQFVQTLAGSALMASVPNILVRSAAAAQAALAAQLDPRAFRNLADLALRTARKLGASYADLRVCRYHTEQLRTREERVESVTDARDYGLGVRVLVEGTWGFASSSRVTADQIGRVTRQAVAIARANRRLQQRPLELETLPAYDDEWFMPMQTDPFTVPLEDKVKLLLGINAAARQAGADFCTSTLAFVKEEKFFASTFGSCLHQTRVRAMPEFVVTVVDKKTGRFETRDSFAAARGAGYEYIRDYDFLGEVARATEEAKQKHTARSVEPGRKDLVIHPTNLWLTIHETVGHPTELDRALGYEANFAGTSFVTPDKLGKLKYGSDLVTILGDRTQPGGLATIGYDDDGARTQGAEFAIIRNGRFTDYQLSVGFARAIGRERSNACAFADRWDKFPLQRMPNISLQPGPKTVSVEELFADIKDGIYILGNGSWSIDHQRYNFQFGGQVFYEIRNGRLGRMLRDVAYQGNTVDFWNACDGLCGREEYFLGGAPNCGKGQPEQVAPVSHGAVPARFRQINVINTSRDDIA
jgi:TldD protein